MHAFRDGEEARVLKRGVETEVVVFRQSGELVYVFDKHNRLYQFHVNDILPAQRKTDHAIALEPVEQ